MENKQVKALIQWAVKQLKTNANHQYGFGGAWDKNIDDLEKVSDLLNTEGDEPND